jgi:hypothetical protein
MAGGALAATVTRGIGANSVARMDRYVGIRGWLGAAGGVTSAVKIVE